MDLYLQRTTISSKETLLRGIDSYVGFKNTFRSYFRLRCKRKRCFIYLNCDRDLVLFSASLVAIGARYVTGIINHKSHLRGSRFLQQWNFTLHPFLRIPTNNMIEIDMNIFPQYQYIASNSIQLHLHWQYYCLNR